MLGLNTLMKSVLSGSPGPCSSTLSSYVRDISIPGVRLQPTAGAGCGAPEWSVGTSAWPADAAAAARDTTSVASGIFMTLVGDDDRVARMQEDRRAAVNRFLVVEGDRLPALARFADDLDVLGVGEVFQSAGER